MQLIIDIKLAIARSREQANKQSKKRNTQKKNSIKINNYNLKFTFLKFKNQNIYIDRVLYRRKKLIYSYKNNL